MRKTTNAITLGQYPWMNGSRAITGVSEMRARVFGTTTAGVLVGVPLGTFVSGYVVTWIGLEYTLLVMGALYFLTTASLLVNPALKKM